MRFDEDQLETLRRWGHGLRETQAEESAAAGRAILLLIEEVERLRLELVRTRELLSRVVPASSDEADAPEKDLLESTLHQRLQPVQEPGSSPESWIEALRRKT